MVRFPRGLGLWAPACSLTSRCLQPLLIDTVSDLGFWVALRKVAGNDCCVPLIYFDHVLHVQLEVLEICGQKERCQWGLDGGQKQSDISVWLMPWGLQSQENSCRSLTHWGLPGEWSESFLQPSVVRV